MADDWSDLKMAVERGMPVRPMSSECECGDLHHNRQRAIVRPGGWIVECLSCERRWVEFELTEPRKSALT